MRPDVNLRVATTADIPVLQALIARSGIGLSAGFYTPEQAQAVTREVFGVDTQLILDGTYFAIADEARILACGGWSKRSTPYGGDAHKSAPDRLLDPAVDAARIRAFFVDPGSERRGLGSMLMRHCTAQAGGGFHRARTDRHHAGRAAVPGPWLRAHARPEPVARGRPGGGAPDSDAQGHRVTGALSQG